MPVGGLRGPLALEKQGPLRDHEEGVFGRNIDTRMGGVKGAVTGSEVRVRKSR